MNVEQEHSCLPVQQVRRNTEDTETGLSSRLDIGLTQEQLLEWYYHLSLQSIPRMLKNETSVLHTFDEATSVFCISYHKKIATAKKLAKLLLHRVRKMLR